MSKMKTQFGILIAFFLVLPSFAFAYSGYTRTPSTSSIDNGTNTTISFDYDSGDSTGFTRTGVFFFDGSNGKIQCQVADITDGGSGNVSVNFGSINDTQVYKVWWGKISSVAPTYDVCGNITNTTNFNSITDGNAHLEEGTPAFIYEPGGGGGGSTGWSFSTVFGEAASTSASSTRSVAIVDNPTQDVMNGFLLFIIGFFGMIWIFSLKR